MVAAFRELADTSREHGLRVATVDAGAHAVVTPRLRRLPSVFVLPANASGLAEAVAVLEGVDHDEVDKDPHTRANELMAMVPHVI